MLLGYGRWIYESIYRRLLVLSSIPFFILRQHRLNVESRYIEHKNPNVCFIYKYFDDEDVVVPSAAFDDVNGGCGSLPLIFAVRPLDADGGDAAAAIDDDAILRPVALLGLRAV